MDSQPHRSSETQELVLHEWTVEPGDEGERLDRFLGRNLYPAYSRSHLAGLVREGRVQVNGGPVRPAYRLVVGDAVRAEVGPPSSETPQAEDLPLDILYEDSHVLVVHKPAGQLVHPGSACHSGTLVNALLHRYPDLHKVGVVNRPGIVHRLDKDTSGVLVVALSNAARSGLLNQFKQRLVKKEYRALVCGKISLQSDYIDLPIGDDPRRHDRMRIDLKEGKPSSTYYEVLERLPGFTLLRVSPLTGRTHQIRVHLAQLGYPVVGDRMYGRGQAHAFRLLKEQRQRDGLPPLSLTRHALHAYRIQFTHPVDGRELELCAPVPPDIEELVELLRAAR